MKGWNRRQRGVALILVLMIFALMSALAVEILYRQDRFRSRTANLLDWDNRYQYAMAAEVVAVQGLIDDLEQDRKSGSFEDDCSNEQWAVNLPPSPYGDAMLSATVQDLQGRFNLNWVIQAGQKGQAFERDPAGVQALQRLLGTLLAQPNKAATLAREMADWADSNNLVDDVDGAEDAEYRYRRTPNMPVAHESELRALHSMTAADIPKKGPFWPFFTALPVGTKLNINTAPVEVLNAVLGFIGGNPGQAITQMRQDKPFSDLGRLFDQEPFKSLTSKQRQQVQSLLGVSSEYFQVMVDVRRDNQRSRLVSRIRRARDGKTEVISRELVPVMGPLESACNPHYNASNKQ